jgi:hypothetical protein
MNDEPKRSDAMIDAELATEYITTSLELLDSEDQVHKLIHEAGDASVLRDWRHWNPDEIPSILEVLRLDKWNNGKAIGAALKGWSDKRYAAHKKYAELMMRAEPQEFLKLPKPDRLDRNTLTNWQAYFSASTNM